MGADGSRPLLGGSGGPTCMHRGTTAKGGGNGGKGATALEGGKASGGEAGRRIWGTELSGANSGNVGAPRDGPGEGKGGTTKGTWTWAKPAPAIDDEGYEMVQPRRVRVQAGDDMAVDQGQEPQHNVQPTIPPTRPRWADDASDDGGDGDEDLQDDGDDWGMEDWGEDDGMDTDPKTLRANFEAHARMVRDMERRGREYRGSPALETLRAARDAAEKAWRDAKAPAPLPVRMGRAEEKLDRAGAALTKARLALDDFDERAERQREELVQRIAEADKWFRWRQQQLDLLHEEAGERVAAKRQGADTAGGAGGIRSRIKADFLPAVQELLEHVEGNPEIVEKLALLAEGLEEAERDLGAAHADRVTESYDIAGDDSADEGGGKGERKGPGCCGAQRYGEAAREGSRSGKASVWKPEGAGRWTRRTAGDDAQPQGKGPNAQGTGAPPAEGADGAAPPAQAKPLGKTGAEPSRSCGSNTPVAGAAAEGATSADQPNGSGASGSSEVDHVQPRAPSGEGEGEHEVQEQAAKHRRRRTAAEARQEMDAKRAMDLLQEQQAAMAAQLQSHQAGTGGFGSEAALSMAAQRFVHEVRQAEARAAKKGIDPRHDGRALLELSPMELQQWVQANLGEESESEY